MVYVKHNTDTIELDLIVPNTTQSGLDSDTIDLETYLCKARDTISREVISSPRVILLTEMALIRL